MDAAEGDHLGAGRLRLTREAKRVAGEVGDILQLGELVVVGEDDRVALGGQRTHLGAQITDLLRSELGYADWLKRWKLLHGALLSVFLCSLVRRATEVRASNLGNELGQF